MEFKLQALSIYEYGQRKDKDGNPHQEDWIYPALGEINNEQDRLFILCDGMGGHAAGEVASAAVCEAMSNTINDAFEKGEKFSEKLLLDAIEAAYNLLDERDTSEDGQKKMGTTMTFLLLHEEGATIAHIGDSRVYHIRPKTGKKDDLVFCTRDHSLVNDLIKIGEITEEEALHHPQKNVITRAMQPHLARRHKADIITTKNIRPGDYFYMCSDGMLEQTSDDNLCFILANDVSDEEKRNMLIRVSKNNRDNHSAHLIHILDVQPEPEIEDAPLPIAPTSSQEIEDDEDVVNPEFDEPNTAEEATTAEEGTNVPATEKEESPNDESKKTGMAQSSSSTAAEGGAEASATFQGERKTSNQRGGHNKLKWGIIACAAIAILGICGIFQSRFTEKQEILTPSKEKSTQNPKGAKKRNRAAQNTTTRSTIPPKLRTDSVSKSTHAPDSLQEASSKSSIKTQTGLSGNLLKNRLISSKDSNDIVVGKNDAKQD